MDANDLVRGYFDHFAQQHPSVFENYISNELWTKEATRALVKVGTRTPSNCEVAARFHTSENEWKRTEYMTLDVVIVSRESWEPPIFTAEHENSGSRARVRYDAWKLLSVKSACRVFVAYFGRGTESPTFDALTEVVAEVCRRHDEGLLLIGGEWSATPTSIETFRAVHDAAFIRGTSVQRLTAAVRETRT
jgi:hypothetical protein